MITPTTYLRAVVTGLHCLSAVHPLGTPPANAGPLFAPATRERGKAQYDN